MLRKGSLILLLYCVLNTHSKSNLSENGYMNLVVGISPDVPEDPDVIDQIKHLMVEASRELLIATRNRAYYKQIKILLPKTWTNTPFDQPLEGEFFEDAEIRVDRPNPVYSDAPYTLRGSSCGEPGSYIHFTPGFLNDNAAYGNIGKVLVHEWAKLRWGVFEEHGYPGDDQFPLFFYKTIFTATGERQVLSYNFCANSRLYGYEQDVRTGGQCSRDADNLPDGNCMFYVTQETSASASYMALPYLSSVQNFCDNTEENIHDSSLPTKQNLYCDGRSTWEVITEHEDFADNNNPADDTIDNTEPEFIVVGSQLSSVDYVLVMDTSLSMQNEPNQMDGMQGNGYRINAMVDAAKRWVKFELPDDVNVGMVTFSDEEHIIPYQAMTVISDTSKDALLEKLEDVRNMAAGKTCIGCGLQMATDYPDLLNGKTGGNILLITDGQQQCLYPSDPSLCVSVAAMTDVLVQRNIRVVTIAMGPDADPEIEDLAQKTGGKSYYVEDYASTGTINDAFGGSTTSQPGDTIGNTDIEIYQRDWDLSSGDSFRDTFDIDSSVGRDLTIQVDVSREKATDTCTQAITIQFAIPGLTEMKEEKFMCSKDNLGVYKKDLSSYTSPDPTPEGRWLYQIIPNSGEKVAISVKVTSKSRDPNSDPILTKCWIATGSQQINSETDLKLSVVADVRQGNDPVIGAKVKAIVEMPSANGNDYPPMEMELPDSGSGADFIKNDGIYSRYFTRYTGKGRYNVKCQVIGDDDTNVNGGFINSKEGRSIPMNSTGSPMCCGSNTITPDSILSSTGNFTRSAVGGAFQVTVDITGNDIIAPSKVVDLVSTLTNSDEEFWWRVTFTEPGDDLDSDEPVASYTIRYAQNLTAQNFETEGQILEQEDLYIGSFCPEFGGHVKEIGIKSSLFALNTTYGIALISEDEAGNKSPVSNIVQFAHFAASSASNFDVSFLFILGNILMAALVAQ